MDTQIATLGFSKALKRELLPVSATLHHPRTGEVISVTLGFRRMTNGELEAVKLQEAARETSKQAALSDETLPEDERLARAAEFEMTDADILDRLAPLFGDKSGRVEVSGIDDFPGADGGTPEERFRRYFGGDGTETDEDLETERLILRVAYGGYLTRFFRLRPLELLAITQSVPVHGGGAATISEAIS